MRKSLSNLLEIIYHGKVTFDDFLNINVESHVTKIYSKKRTIYKVSDKLKLLHSFLNLVVFEYLNVVARKHNPEGLITSGFPDSN
jgi:hypothetical protein